VNLNANAPTGGLAIAITPNPSTFVTVPTTVTVPATQSSVTFSIAVSIDAPSGVINFAANRPGGGLASRGLTIQSAGPTALTLSATSVQGGQAVTATMNLGGPAALAFTMPISSNNATASVPASLSINTGVATPQFTIQTSAVTSATTVTITAGAGANAKTATLTITP
jgi:hypothetical protein